MGINRHFLPSQCKQKHTHTDIKMQSFWIVLPNCTERGSIVLQHRANEKVLLIFKQMITQQIDTIICKTKSKGKTKRDKNTTSWQYKMFYIYNIKAKHDREKRNNTLHAEKL